MVKQPEHQKIVLYFYHIKQVKNLISKILRFLISLLNFSPLPLRANFKRYLFSSYNENEMKKWTGVLIPVILVLVLTSFGTLPFFNNVAAVPDFLKTSTSQSTVGTISKQQAKVSTYEVMNIGKTFIGYKEAIGFKESQGKYDTINRLGYLGKYQFGKSTLRLLGIKDPEAFISNPLWQEQAFEANVARNKWILRRDIKRFSGKKIKGTVITESGIVAAAHLAGAGNVKKYLRSYGKNDVADAFGSSVGYYLRKFSGYDIAEIPKEKTPKSVFNLRLVK